MAFAVAAGIALVAGAVALLIPGDPAPGSEPAPEGEPARTEGVRSVADGTAMEEA